MRQTQVIVDLENIRDNTRMYRSLLRPDTKLMTVLKANAYGMGAVAVSRAVLEAGADWIGVALREEGQILREAGINVPMLVLGYTGPDDYAYMIQEELRPTIFRQDMAQAYSGAAQALGKAVKVHLKIDTGLHRIGFAPTEETVKLIIEMQALPYLEVEGIYTHFAMADGEDPASMAEQFRQFSQLLVSLEAKGVNIPICHCANTPATMRFPESHLDMVRIAIGIYGEYPGVPAKAWGMNLKPAVSMRTILVDIKTIPQGTAIGYNLCWTAARDTVIGVLPLGYVDLYTRESWNKVQVLIRGRRVPAIGRLNMDMVMIDLSDIPQPALGEEVVLIGRQGEEVLSLEELATWMNSNNYEVMSKIAGRVPRVYREA